MPSVPNAEKRLRTGQPGQRALMVEAKKGSMPDREHDCRTNVDVRHRTTDHVPRSAESQTYTGVGRPLLEQVAVGNVWTILASSAAHSSDTQGSKRQALHATLTDGYVSC